LQLRPDLKQGIEYAAFTRFARMRDSSRNVHRNVRTSHEFSLGESIFRFLQAYSTIAL